VLVDPAWRWTVRNSPPRPGVGRSLRLTRAGLRSPDGSPRSAGTGRPISLIGRSPRSIRMAGDGCRSTIRRTFATRWPASARSPSTMSPLATVHASGCSTPRKGTRSSPSGSSPASCNQRELSGQHEARPVALPSGFVTMPMTDIESSTAPVQRLGEGYHALIDEVWAVLRRCVAGRGGNEVEARADEFFAVFEAPRSAVDAAVSIQHAFPGRSWPVDADVRVRTGIHSGYPTSTRTNYVGVDVNATSRICAVGHGGQVLVSANTRGGGEGVGSRRGAFHCARPPPVTGPA